MSIFLKHQTKLRPFLVFFLSLMASENVAGQCGAPAVGCSTTDRANYGFNSNNNPNTIEYDNFISAYHGTMVLTSNGTFQVWGESMGNSGVVAGTYGTGTHLLSPVTLDNVTYPALTGTPLKVATGGNAISQQVVLTTTGLFAWGHSGALIDPSFTPTTTFQKITINGKADGLPPGVTPADVKMLYGTFQTLVITTCSGNVWVLAANASARGNGGVGLATVWSQVTTAAAGNPALTNVVAARGTYQGLMALKSDGTLWTWGSQSLDAAGTPFTDRNRAVQMALPAGITPKMIGATCTSSLQINLNPTTFTSSSSYYVLATNGNLYSIGSNAVGQLGDWTTTDKLVWTQPRYTSAVGPVMSNVKWLSPNEHDIFYPAVNIINTSAGITGWCPSNPMVGTVASNNPGTPQGIGASDVILAVETGGHTSMVVNECFANFGYVGHRTNGSMGDGTVTNTFEDLYTYNTAPVQICGAESMPQITILEPPTGSAGKYCSQTTITINTAPAGGVISLTSGPATLLGNQLTITGAGTIVVTYDTTDACGITTSKTLTIDTEVCCNSGTDAPILSATNINNVCPATTVNLTSITASNTPAGTTLTWHSGSPASTANLVATPTSVSAAIYYTAFFDAINNCYSPTSAITATIFVCPTAIISGSGNICQSTDSLSIVLTGSQPWSITYTDGATPTTISGITTSPYTVTVTPTTTVTYSLTAISDANTLGTFSGNATFNRKIWNGSVNSDWNNTSNWTPAGIPVNTDYVVIPPTANNPIISGTTYHTYACVLLVKNGASLNIYSSNSITVTNQVIVEPTGTFQLDNTASLVQVNDVVNSGNIIYKRVANVRNLDYVYWSSPVLGMNISNLITPLTFGPIYRWNPIVANTNGGEGNWEPAAAETMLLAKGYITRAPGSFNPTIAQPLEATFIGTPNNGSINFTISRGTDTNTNYHQGTNGIEINNFSDNWNLTGNPYPSAIRASQFLLNNASKIEGNVKLWTHGTLPSTAIPSPFYATFASNYTSNDYLSYNFTGTNCCPLAPADLFVGAGQGFFVQMKDGPAASDVINFENTLRDATYSNSLFYRSTNPLQKSTENTIDINTLERNRIWLDIVKDTGESDRTLFGYIQSATMDFDSFFDTHTMISGPMIIYTVQGDKKFLIQGRQLPFDDNDEVSIGVHLPNSGNYAISIAAVDGLFTTQNIFLRDQFLNVIHDIKSAPYNFTSTATTINSRFKIIYKNNTLDNPNYDSDASLQISTNNYITIKSSLQPIKEVVVFDVLGRRLKEYKAVNTYQISLLDLQKTNSILLVKVILQNDIEVVKKVKF